MTTGESSSLAKPYQADHTAVAAFLAKVKDCGARRVWLEPVICEDQPKALSLGMARFRPKQEDPDIGGDEGTVGFGEHRISLDGLHAWLNPAETLKLADRWGDSVVFAMSLATFGAAVTKEANATGG